MRKRKSTRQSNAASRPLKLRGLFNFPLALILLVLCGHSKAQSVSSPKLSIWDGMIVAGYVGHGGYADFGGPSIKWSMKPCSIALGLFPAVRIKKDKVAEGAKKNSSIVPSTGFGITSNFKHLVIQIPVFYDAKTASADGKWNLGVGIGYKF
jgi:hypothetical protein